ncbi:uncharacterized protein [Macrobrachium rosenbergii]|uniref:uncharacterized protein n=1 Tax=Macrobrachium rosenbergii TaxID=79674 RepID=UPI0034D72FA7
MAANSLLDLILYQNLAFRGHNEKIRDADNRNIGNFLGLVKLIAEFDPIMRNHLDYGEQNAGSVSYLSPLVQNEFIQLLASTARNKLFVDICQAKCYGLLFDSTPDSAHREQMSETCYDNAAVMARHKSGVQQRIIEKNSKAVFVNCDNHSLNLAGIHAASEESVTVTFFDTLDALYNFFSRPTMRWDKLRKAMPIN